MPNWGLGRVGQVYVKEESSYGTAPTLASTDAVRHLNVGLKYDPRKLRKSPERHTDPSMRVLLTGRSEASFDLKAQLYPSGTLNTLPEFNVLLKGAFGQAATNITLSTTFSGTPTTTTGTVGSATGLAAGQPVQISIAAGASAGVYVRWLTSATSGTALVWAPALPAAPVSGDACKGTIGYAPATNNTPTSFDVAHYPQAPSTYYNREQLGCVANKLSIMFDSNLETMATVSGPAKGYASSAQAQPGAFTTVGAESAIPSGLTGYFQLGSTLYQIEKLQLDIDNGYDLQNTALGTASPVAAFRKGRRAVTLKVQAKVSDDLTLWTPSLSQASNTLMLQLGTTSARIFGLYCPAVTIMNPPDTPDADETNNWSFDLTALATSGNDEVYFAAA
jgi:hypothetical protein